MKEHIQPIWLQFRKHIPPPPRRAARPRKTWHGLKAGDRLVPVDVPRIDPYKEVQRCDSYGVWFVGHTARYENVDWRLEYIKLRRRQTKDGPKWSIPPPKKETR